MKDATCRKINTALPRVFRNEDLHFLLLSLFSFADASIIPFPITTFFVILLWMHPLEYRKYFLAIITGTVLGALAGYMTGYGINNIFSGNSSAANDFIIHYFPGFSPARIKQITDFFDIWGFGILFVSVFTPIPYSLFAIFSGIYSVNIFVFIISVLLSHTLKYTLLIFFITRSERGIRRVLET